MGYYLCKVSFFTGEVSKTTGKAKANKSEIIDAFMNGFKTSTQKDIFFYEKTYSNT